MEILQMSTIQNSNFIDGEWSSNGEAFDSINPSNTSDCVGRFSAATSNDCK